MTQLPWLELPGRLLRVRRTKEMELMGFLALMIVGSVWSSSEVKQSVSSFSCCGSPRLPYEPGCENTWTADGKTFAHIHQGEWQCIPPCKSFDGHTVVLDGCVNVNLSTVCTNTPVTEESRKIYLADECQYSTSSGVTLGFEGLVNLLGETILGRLFLRMIR
ncbi:uncharacterized protein ACNS7B_018273 isoform 2-T2 [Menidia menidia]